MTSRAVCHMLDALIPTDDASVPFLSTVTQSLEQAQKERDIIESKKNVVAQSMPRVIQRLADQANTAVSLASDLEAERVSVSDELERHRKNPESIMTDLNDLITNHRTCAATLTYILAISHVREYCDRVQSDLERKNPEGALDAFTLLTELAETVAKLHCKRLSKYIVDCNTKMAQLLKTKLLQGLKDAMAAMQWPKSLESIVVADTTDSVARFAAAARLVAKWQLLHGGAMQAINAALPPLVLVDAMVQPIKQRFLFHFEGARKTARRDKPEWFFTFILNHLRDHQAFMANTVQGVIDDAGLHQYSAFTEFTKGLVTIASEKVSRLFPAITDSPSLLSHCVDEIMAFEKSVRETYLFPEVYPICLPSICADPQLFSAWKSVEYTLASDEYEAIVNDTAAWELHFGPLADVDEFKTTKSAARLTNLLRGVTERLTAITNWEQQMSFVDDIQRRLLEEYYSHIEETFTGDLKRALAWGEHNIGKWPAACALVNSLEYCQVIMKDWAEHVVFLELQQHVDKQRGPQGDPVGEETVFDGIVSDYCNLRNELTSYLVDVVANNFKHQAAGYKKKHRFEAAEMSHLQIDGTLTISRELTQALVGLKEFLHTAESLLGKGPFAYFWRSLTEKINMHLFREVLERKMFDSAVSGEQFAHDVYSVFLLFKPFTNRPENFFKETKESAFLLCLPKERVMDIRERVSQCTTHDPKSEKDLYDYLEKLKIYKLGPAQVLEVLAKRVDCDIDSDDDSDD